MLLLALLILIISIALPWKRIWYSQKGEGYLNVSVTVLPRRELKILYQTPSLTVTESDIEQGYLDIPAATKLYIHDNDRSGYVLLFEGLHSPFNQAVIRGLSQDIQIAQPAAYIHQPYSRQPITTSLSYHFNLVEGTKPGNYPWPLSISIPPGP